MIIEIAGKQVEVDDSFKDLSDEEKQNQVNLIAAEIASGSMSGGQEEKTGDLMYPAGGAAIGATTGAIIGPAVGETVDIAAEAAAKKAAGKPAVGPKSTRGVEAWHAQETTNPFLGGRTKEEAYERSQRAAGKPTQSRGSEIPIRKGYGFGSLSSPAPELSLPQKAASNILYGERLGTPSVPRRVGGMGIAGAEAGKAISDIQAGETTDAILSGIGALGGILSQSRIKPLRAIGTGLSVLVPTVQGGKEVKELFYPPKKEEPEKKAHGGLVHLAGGRSAIAEEGIKKLKNISLADLEGKTLLGTISDRTRVGGGLHGGPMFPTIHPGAAWAMDAPGAATRLLNAMKQAGGPEQTVVAPMLMSSTAHRSNRDVAKLAAEQFRKNVEEGMVTPQRLQEINERIRAIKGLEEHPGMLDPNVKNMMDKLTFGQRRELVDILASKPKTAMALDLNKLLRETTEPGLYDEPLGAIGPSVFKLSGERSVDPTLHGSYSHILHGEPVGAIKPVPRQFLFRDLENKARKELGRELSDYNYQRSVGIPAQLIDEPLLRSLEKYADGGLSAPISNLGIPGPLAGFYSPVVSQSDGPPPGKVWSETQSKWVEPGPNSGAMLEGGMPLPTDLSKFQPGYGPPPGKVWSETQGQWVEPGPNSGAMPSINIPLGGPTNIVPTPLLQQPGGPTNIVPTPLPQQQPYMPIMGNKLTTDIVNPNFTSTPIGGMYNSTTTFSPYNLPTVAPASQGFKNLAYNPFLSRIAKLSTPNAAKSSNLLKRTTPLLRGNMSVPLLRKPFKEGGHTTPAWQRKEGKSPSGGLNALGRASYKRETGGTLKAPQPEGGSRKKSFCARMGGMKKKLTSSKTANDPDSRINKALRKWKC
jgi:hypothetical protein